MEIENEIIVLCENEVVNKDDLKIKMMAQPGLAACSGFSKT